MTALISYRNWVDTGTLTAPSGSVAGYPVSNLQTRQLGVTWKSAVNALGTQIIVDLGLARTVRLIGLLGVPTANASASDGGAPSHIDYYVDRSPDGVNWTLVGQSILQDYMWPGVAPHGYLALSTPLSYRYWRIRTNWGWPIPGGIEAGRLWIGDAIALPGGVHPNWTLLVDDSGEVDESEGLQAYEDRGERRRRMPITIVSNDTMTFFGFNEGAAAGLNVPSIQGMQMATGKTSEVIVLPRSIPGVTSSYNHLWPKRLGIYGRFVKPVAIKNLSSGRYEASMEVLEER